MRKKRLSRSTVILLTCLLAVPTVPELMYGTDIWGNPNLLKPCLAAGFLLGLAHLLLRPLLRLIAAPIGCLTLGLSGTVIDVGLIYLAAELAEGFARPEFLCALLTALLINVVCAAFAR